jgi:hypothetical protein
MLYFETFYHLSNYERIYASLFSARYCNSSHSKHIYELFILKYIQTKCVDVDSQQTGTAMNTTISATIQNCQVTTYMDQTN